MSETQAALFANDAFYVAFASRDVAAMDDVWASTAPVSCIHPGWNVLNGRTEVMESWQAILGGRGAPQVACQAPAARIHGDVAIVVCYERLEGGFLIATNIFVREGGRWKMVHHQAAPTRRVESNDNATPERIQ